VGRRRERHNYGVGRWGHKLEGRHSGTTESLNTIFGTTDGKRLWALTPSSIVASEDGGASWTERYGGRYKLVDIRGTGVGGEVWAIAIGGAIIESEDGGASWTARYHDTKGNISSIFVTSDGQRLWAVGECCTILGSDDGGASWKARYGLTDNNLRSIFGTSDGMHCGPSARTATSWCPATGRDLDEAQERYQRGP